MPRASVSTRIGSYSLSTLLGLIVVISAILGWWRYSTRDERAFYQIRANGGEVWATYDWENFPGGELVIPCAIGNDRTDWRARRPEEYLTVELDEDWALKHFPSSWIQDLGPVEAIEISGCPHLNEQWFVRLGSLDQIHTLQFHRVTLQGRWFSHLSDLESLGCLDVSGCRIGDEGLWHLARFNSLRELRLTETQLTNRGCNYLPSELQRLTLRGTSITDKCVPALCRLKRLEYIDVSATRLSRDGFLALSQLPNLEVMSAFHTIEPSVVAECMSNRKAGPPLEIQWKVSEAANDISPAEPFSGGTFTHTDPFGDQLSEAE